MALAAGSHLGQYEIIPLLGAGGMGEVYRARDTKLRRDVALVTALATAGVVAILRPAPQSQQQ